MHILAISGSLRKDSFNTALVHAAQETAPEGVTVTLYPIGDLPLYNTDLEANLPDVVKKLKDAVASADAILLSTPEYNYSVPGVLKNAIDWISRPYGQNSMEGKPVGVMGASIGPIATARAQYELRKILFYLNTHPVNRPEVMVGIAQDKIDASGKITDEKTKEKVQELVVSLVDWTKKVKTLA